MDETEASLAKDPAQAVGVIRDLFALSQANATSLYKNVQIIPLQQQANPKYAYNLVNNTGTAAAVQPVISFMQGLNLIPQPVTSSSLFAPSYLTSYLKTVTKPKTPTKKT
jgi:hypothetical protein